MNPTSVFYIGATVVLCALIFSCSGAKQHAVLSDEATKAIAESCSKVGQVMHFKSGFGETLAECRQP